MSYDRISQGLRELIERDGGTCWLCGGQVRLDVEWKHPGAPTADHVRAKRWGGTRDPSNLRLAHKFCNSHRQHGIVRKKREYQERLVVAVHNYEVSLVTTSVRTPTLRASLERLNRKR